MLNTAIWALCTGTRAPSCRFSSGPLINSGLLLPLAAQDEDHRLRKPEEFQVHMAQQSVSGGGKESFWRSFPHSVPVNFYLIKRNFKFRMSDPFLIWLPSCRRSHYTQTSMAVFETFSRNVKRLWSSQTKAQRSSGINCCLMYSKCSFHAFTYPVLGDFWRILMKNRCLLSSNVCLVFKGTIKSDQRFPVADFIVPHRCLFSLFSVPQAVRNRKLQNYRRSPRGRTARMFISRSQSDVQNRGEILSLFWESRWYLSL